MFQLTLDLKTSAQALGIAPEAFLKLVEREHIQGVIKLQDDWRISIFTLAQLLNTTPDILLELIEDYALGRMIEEVDNDEWFEGQDGQQIYAGYLAEAQE